MNTNDYETIQLTKQDLRYLHGQIYENTASKLDLHLPTSPNDPLKSNVAVALDDFLLDVFEMALDALVVDGSAIEPPVGGPESRRDVVAALLALDSSEQKTEPFDFELNAELRKVIQQVEEETVEVTRYRRELPQDSRNAYEELVGKTDAEVTELLRQIDHAEAAPVVPGELDPERAQLIERDYYESLQRLVKLNQVLPEQRADISRLAETILFLEDFAND
jgi:kinetochor protein Mis14/NSL1